LVALPELAREPEVVSSLTYAVNWENASLRRTLLGFLLGGRLELRQETREMCRNWLSNIDRDRGIKTLVQFPLGRRAMAELLSAAGPGPIYSGSGRILDALLEAHPRLRGLRTVHERNEAWADLSFRAGVGKLLILADRDPAADQFLLAQSVSDADRQLASAAATALADDQYRGRLGILMEERVRRLCAIPYDGYLGQPLPIVAGSTGSPSVTPHMSAMADVVTPGFRSTISSWLWWGTGALSMLIMLGTAILLLSVTIRMPGSHEPMRLASSR
jgi:hypothetical protein